MAIGTITVNNQEATMASQPSGILNISFLGDDSYPTGGTASFQASVQAILGRAVTVIGVMKAGATGVYTAIYDKANDKLYVEDAAGAQVGSGTDLSSTTFILAVFYE